MDKTTLLCGATERSRRKDGGRGVVRSQWAFGFGERKGSDDESATTMFEAKRQDGFPVVVSTSFPPPRDRDSRIQKLQAIAKRNNAVPPRLQTSHGERFREFYI